MTVEELAGVLYEETKVEVSLNYDLVFTGVAEEAKNCKYKEKSVKEVYITPDGSTLIIEIGENAK